MALNRSMLAAVYGPFNVRNEVDVHADIVGGHFNNTHFLTGDGGMFSSAWIVSGISVFLKVFYRLYSNSF